jgi:hypothetical protein
MNFRQYFILTLLAISLTCCNRSHTSVQTADTNKITLIDSMPYIKFTNPIATIGKIMSGEKAGMDFVFFNAGKKSLIILDAKASCGCTVPEWDKNPVLPGEKGKVRVVYDSSGELGMQNKSIRIISNARNNETDLIISAEVLN